jgi:hypothetical protein
MCMDMEMLERVRVGVGDQVRVDAPVTLVFVRDGREFQRVSLRERGTFLRRVDGVRVFRVVE